MSIQEQGPGFALRPMRGEDLAAVGAVERAAYAYPWSDEIFQDCLRVGYCCWVGEIARDIVAHGIMSVAVGECHIFNLCVHPRCQRQGLGRALLRHLLSLALKRKADTAFLEVRASNSGARALYVSEGFCEIGTRRKYYPAGKGREDATVLAKELRSPDFGEGV
ncbi:ribosomal protein S18-alanine N-acetyltransferase [Thiocystis violascens]|uniref:[Ribosomal protein bS18]-alanine N-acetyltransferase n=1 Tax=Thiocystis violascens (strain ATCC 17096 / DSM 198 / 6111) TaxID=765911 RepID=I3YF88_THIV6|nr:ribosomal protein S18-alanine N-acetyltransferase [Thiocystis violascens]AFL75656.1 (SSU ribosomal protein S18P)-alanine acetyltransferase [Thiocystis violascens DSM 198]